MTKVPSEEFWHELEAEGLVEPVPKPQIVRLERRLTEARERHRDEIAEKRQRYLEQSREPLPSGDGELFLDAVPRVARFDEVRDAETPDLNRFDGGDFGDDVYGPVHEHPAGEWPE